jgi:molybdenum cofactor biosynthesis protein B
MPAEHHRRKAEKIEVKFCLLITSDAVYDGRRKDELTPLVTNLMRNYGFNLSASIIVPNNERLIEESITKLINEECDSIIITGGTGLSKRDISVDIVKSLCSKEIPGFGELFRYLTYLREGTLALASRAMACLYADKIFFVIPGSKAAVKLALEKLIFPEIKHLIYEIRK